MLINFSNLCENSEVHGNGRSIDLFEHDVNIGLPPELLDRPSHTLGSDARAQTPKSHLQFTTTPPTSPTPQQPRKHSDPGISKETTTPSSAGMATSYTAYDQAADLGIHRVHSLVLGDARKEARIAARFAPAQIRRPALGRGDIRHEEQRYNWETRMELDKIARRNNLKT